MKTITIKLPENEANELDEFIKNEIFWHLEYNLSVLRQNYEDYENCYCKKEKGHFSEKMILASTKQIICPICYLRGNPEKQEKIEPIKNRFEILDIRNKEDEN